MKGRHKTRKSSSDPTYCPQWSGVSHAPHVKGRKCAKCGSTDLHKEGDSVYCPACDDYVGTLPSEGGE